MPAWKKIAIAVLAALTVTVGGLGIVRPAAARPACSEEKEVLIDQYQTHALVFYGLGYYSLADYWWAKADAVIRNC